MNTPYDYRVNRHISSRLKGVLNNAVITRDSKVITYKDASAFPVTGRDGVLYIDDANNTIYRWNSVIGNYVPLDSQPTPSLTVVTGITMSYDQPESTGILWVDMSDNNFIKYYDGTIWRRSNMILLCDPEDIDSNDWIIIPDNETESPEDPEQSDDNWIIIPDEEEETP